VSEFALFLMPPSNDRFPPTVYEKTKETLTAKAQRTQRTARPGKQQQQKKKQRDRKVANLGAGVVWRHDY